MVCSLELGGMPACDLVAWIILATFAGAWSREIMQGKLLLGLWSDMMVGLIGAFTITLILQKFDVDIGRLIVNPEDELAELGAKYLNVFITAFIGAMFIRLALKTVKN